MSIVSHLIVGVGQFEEQSQSEDVLVLQRENEIHFSLFVRCPEWLVETGQDLGIGKGDRPP